MAMRERKPIRRGRRARLATVDYTLAKRALLGEVRDGLTSWTDICDAHPELMRAAKHVGEPSRRDCPVCDKAKLKLVTYVYGDGLKLDNGRVWPLDVGLSMAADRPGAWCYVVEVCTECRWNHLHEAFVARAV
ncbi:MAG TPA: DUF5318 family protein [Actinomycetota bacterium]|jgi:hypothetical protein